MLEGFEQKQIETAGATINLVVRGSGPPLLLLHGYPETHFMWHRVAPRLAQDFTVVAADLNASARIRTGAKGGSDLKIEFDDETQPSASQERATVQDKDDGKVVRIYTRHPITARTLPEDDASAVDTPAFRALEAEIVTFAVVQYIQERRGATSGQREVTVTDAYLTHHQEIGKLLPKVQKVLLVG